MWRPPYPQGFLWTICEPMFDGDESDANYQSKIDYTRTFAFKDFMFICL